MELHGLENASGRTLLAEEQDRRDSLRDRIGELNAFDETLFGIIAEGFTPASVKPLLRQFSINDAMLCLKSRWLRRLGETVAAGPLADWKIAADRTELHPDLSAWIADAMSHLDHHCTAVGPRPPERTTLAADPTAGDLAAMIDPEMEEMVPAALTWGAWLAEQAMYDQVSTLDGKRPPPQTVQEFILQEGAYHPDVNDGVRVNIAPLQKAGILVADVLAARDVEKAIADRVSWRDDERRWCREGKLPKPGWWE